MHDELAQNSARVSVDTPYGPVIGGRAANGAVIFLGTNLFFWAFDGMFPDKLLIPEIPYALPPGRFEDPVALPNDYRYEVKEYIQESICRYSFRSFCFDSLSKFGKCAMPRCYATFQRWSSTR